MYSVFCYSYHRPDPPTLLLFTVLGGGTANYVYYESIKREIKIRGIYECRCDERLQTKIKEFKGLVYTGLVLELEHLKIETRLMDEKLTNTRGEYVTER